MTLHRHLASSLESFGALVALFLAHRLLSFGLLSTTELTPALLGQALFVGFLSDLWIAALGATLITLTVGLVSVLGFAFASHVARVALLALFGLMFAAHQAYVDFYHAQLVPFHLRYLLDPDFVAANGVSIIGFRPLLVLLALMIPVFTLLVVDPFERTRTRRLAIAVPAVLCLSLYAHNRNIHYRVQWFVEDHLQVNAVERLYQRLTHESLPRPLSSPEMTALASALDAPAPESPSTPRGDELLRLLTRPAVLPTDDQAVAPFERVLTALFAQDVAAGKKPIVLVALLESLRPSETGYFAPGQAPSLTPRLDGLAGKGVVFPDAFSTGSVTRGGQEAVFCGYLGSRDTSLLRGQTEIDVGCLPDLVKRAFPKPPAVFWYHGGEARFDNQLAFWKGRGLADSLARQDFAADAPHTDWGVGDRTFFKEAAHRLDALDKSADAPFLLGMALSVSNHIPWKLPIDAESAPSVPDNPAHPSYATTAYTDVALGELVDRLRELALWDKTLLVVVSDHGNNVPPYVELYQDSPTRAQRLQSHVNFVLSGGLTDRALTALQVPNLTVDRLTSQSDVAPLIAAVIGLPDARFMGENPLRATRRLPVLSILEEDLFDPAASAAYRTGDAARRDVKDLDPSRATPILYFRAFLQYTNTWNAKPRHS